MQLFQANFLHMALHIILLCKMICAGHNAGIVKLDSCKDFDINFVFRV